jgi:hypothetical protein
MTKIYVNFRKGASTTSGVWDTNNYDFSTGFGVVSSDLLDEAATPTGASFEIGSNAFTQGLGSPTTATADSGDFTDKVFDYAWYFAVATPPELLFSGLPANTSFTFTFASMQPNVARTTTASIGGVSETYAPSGDPANPNPPLTIAGTTDAQGDFSVQLSAASVFGYLDGFIIEYAEAAGPSIDNIDGDNEVRAGQQNVVITGTAIENATSVTLGGETLTIV